MVIEWCIIVCEVIFVSRLSVFVINDLTNKLLCVVNVSDDVALVDIISCPINQV